MKKIFTLLLLSCAWLSNAQNNFDPFDYSPVGYWTFEDNANLGKAEAGYGSDLVLSSVGAFTQVAGPAGTFAIQSNPTAGINSFLACTHSIAPNGGGTRVNQWSIMIDFSVPALPAWNCLFDTNPATPGGDGELYIRSNGGVGSGNLWGWYTGGASVVTTDTWNRLVVTVDLTQAIGSRKLYVNGVEWMSADGVAIDDARKSLLSIVNFLGDPDFEQATINLAQVAIWDRALLPAEVAQMAGASLLGTAKFSAANNTLKVYPNPVNSGSARISFNMPSASKNASIELIDLTGRVVENIFKGSVDQGEQTISWSAKNKYNAGNYIVRLTSEDINQTFSVILK
ncbi:MAG: T9SS type A sorting domain-containing protein [Flavobacterium sp.]|uniref:T9SS type A sorting domain-containing protein n=1 Tax=Flavobacterium sp. TaxID=239 RepID=UPI0026152942|nr:T9SS type A sorting domain-containing protein [Flavobacterium sp.]MDD5149863.1 T9SS type A sorting domain-containing protein [Flavobacterium sp.]